MSRMERSEARAAVRGEVDGILAGWRGANLIRPGPRAASSSEAPTYFDWLRITLQLVSSSTKFLILLWRNAEHWFDG